ncbi:MAG: hypothetical protein J6P98_01705 [Clostridia bacterium]|nr:hypothetical protein [Clostridia bacterium]
MCKEMQSKYYENALIKAEEYRKKEAPLILGIESSCDETAAAAASPV